MIQEEIRNQSPRACLRIIWLHHIYTLESARGLYINTFVSVLIEQGLLLNPGSSFMASQNIQFWRHSVNKEISSHRATESTTAFAQSERS